MTKLIYSLQINVTCSPTIKRWLKLAIPVCEKLLPTTISVAEVGIVLCGDKRIKNLNQSYRNKNKVTDVLSFPLQQNIRRGLYQQTAQALHLGDVVISLPQARRQAKKFNISTPNEAVHLYFHGFLHLLGYDHELSQSEEKNMEELEKKLITIFEKKIRRKKKSST